MKKILFLLTLLFSASMQIGAQTVTFEISSGVDAGTLKSKIEKQMSTLLTAINDANQRKGDVNFSGLDISNDASASLTMTWNNINFRTKESQYSYPCVALNGSYPGYRVRDIAVTMVPMSGSDYKGDKERSIYIDFDRNGKIVDFNFSMGLQTLDILKEGERLKDIDRRLQIIDWCDKFANAYCKKDTAFMQAVFSNDALIITGKVITQRVHTDVGLKVVSKVKYVEQTKTEYLNNLKMAFKSNKYINVQFDDYQVVRHGSKPNYYGVTLRQKWNASRYSDEGTVFLIWDFTNEDEPRILVRTWQPLTEKAFKMGDFKLPDNTKK